MLSIRLSLIAETALSTIIYLRQFYAKDIIPSAGLVIIRGLGRFCPQLGFLGCPAVNLAANKIVKFGNNCREDRQVKERFLSDDWSALTVVNALEIIVDLGYAINNLTGYE
jgi:hypothetical protein